MQLLPSRLSVYRAVRSRSYRGVSWLGSYRRIVDEDEWRCLVAVVLNASGSVCFITEDKVKCRRARILRGFDDWEGVIGAENDLPSYYFHRLFWRASEMSVGSVVTGISSSRMEVSSVGFTRPLYRSRYRCIGAECFVVPPIPALLVRRVRWKERDIGLCHRSPQFLQRFGVP